MNDAYCKSTLPAMALVLLCLAAALPYSARGADLRLYVLDCGHATFKDMGGFSDTGEYDGKSGEIAVPCFLVRHPKGDLLWDTGLGDHYNYPKEGSDAAPGVYNTDRADTLASMSRIETILKNTHGRLIVQHDPTDFQALPQPPGYLD
jgi:N-acyl homoserine lactone hydrolase